MHNEANIREVVLDCLENKDAFLFPITVQKQHIDGLNHTNNAVYVQFCEAAAWAHSEHLGLGLKDYQRLDRAMVVRKAEYDYLGASFEGEQLVVATYLSDFQGASMKRWFQIIRIKGKQTLLKSVWSLGCIELSSGRPIKCPAEFVETYLGPR